MKNLKKNTIILLIISIIFVYFIVKDNFIETVMLIRSANLFWIILSFILFYIYVLLEAYILKNIIKEYKSDYSIKNLFKLQVMTKFFNGITPFASGGQPLQIYELSKEGIEPTKGTMAIVQSFLIFQFSIIILGIISVILNIVFNLFHLTPHMFWMLVFGFTLNIIAFTLVYTISCNKNANKFINRLINRIINKNKFIKNKEEKVSNINKYFTEYYEGFCHLRSNKKMFIKCFLLELLSLVILFVIPQCIFNALSIEHNLNLFVTSIISTYIFIVGSYIPIPGGTGGVEYSFLTFFKGFTTTGALTSGLIVWRFITYYAPVAIGGIVFNLFSKKD